MDLCFNTTLSSILWELHTIRRMGKAKKNEVLKLQIEKLKCNYYFQLTEINSISWILLSLSLTLLVLVLLFLLFHIPYVTP